MIDYIGKIIETEEGYKIRANKNELLEKTSQVKTDFIDTFVECEYITKFCDNCPFYSGDDYYTKGCLYVQVSFALDLIKERIEKYTIESED